MKFSHITAFCAFFLFTVMPAGAQTIAIDELGAADAYEAGVIDITSGGLDPALWQGTSALQAAALMDRAPVHPKNALINDLVSAAILSGGVPPQGDAEALAAYRSARVKAAIQLARKSELDALLRRAPQLTSDAGVLADIALSRGDVVAACQTADSVQDGRAKPQWARLRAFCHNVRGENAAAELTIGLLKETSYQDKTYYALMDNLLGISTSLPKNISHNEPLFSAMLSQLQLQDKTDKLKNLTLSPAGYARLALTPELSPDERLQAMFKGGSALSDDQIRTVLSDLAFDTDSLETFVGFDLESAMKAPPPQAMGQLYALAKGGGSAQNAVKAVSQILERADKAGAFTRFSEFMTPEISYLPGEIQGAENLKLFTRVAVNRGDIATLQGLYQSLQEDSAQRDRIALISDAIGNGFALGDLGKDIETRLRAKGAKKTRAIRDSYLALAMGANLSDSAAEILETTDGGEGASLRSGEILALRAAAAAGSRAETVLRSAILLDRKGGVRLNDPSLAAIIMALNTVGLSNFAGRLAAEDFLAGL